MHGQVKTSDIIATNQSGVRDVASQHFMRGIKPFIVVPVLHIRKSGFSVCSNLLLDLMAHGQDVCQTNTTRSVLHKKKRKKKKKRNVEFKMQQLPSPLVTSKNHELNIVV